MLLGFVRVFLLMVKFRSSFVIIGERSTETGVSEIDESANDVFVLVLCLVDVAIVKARQFSH